MWTRRRFLERIGAGVGAVATLRADAVARVRAAEQGVKGRSAQEMAADEDYWPRSSRRSRSIATPST
jgi:hypothetical protein